MPIWLTPILEFLNKKKAYVFLAALCFYGGCQFGGCTGLHMGPTPSAEYAFGWKDDPERVRQVVSTFKQPFFGDAAKGIIRAEEDKDALLYLLFKKATGKDWVPHNQGSVGSCVGHGMSGAMEMLSAVQITMHNENDEYQPLSAAAAYALSREVGNFLGNQDGSTGADAAKAAMQYGNISCKDAGDDNSNTSIGPPLCKKWGKIGLPQDKKAIAVKHLVKTASQVRTPEEARAALVNGYPLTIASSVGFEGGGGGFKRDGDGFCRAGGSWAHQMFVAGYRADKKAFLIFQSWGSNAPPGPKSLDQPDGTFWINWKDMQRIIAAGETYALSGFEGYPAQNIDVFIRRDEPARYATVRNSQSFTLAP